MPQSLAVSTETLNAFGINANAALKPLHGGSLTCYHADDVVLRPSEDDPESEQIAEILLALAKVRSQNANYRISRPIAVTGAASPTRFVHRGWTAWSFLSWKPRDCVAWKEMLQTCQEFHTDIGKLDITKPEFLNRRMNKFRAADLVAWGDRRLDEFPNLSDPTVDSHIAEPVRQLEAMKRAFEKHMPDQLIHSDICGNMLFEQDGQPPAIIDMTFLWRPSELGAAIAVTDGLIWNKQGKELVDMYRSDSDSIQILVRALLYRAVAWLIDISVVGAEEDRAWRERMLPLLDFENAVNVLRKYID